MQRPALRILKGEALPRLETCGDSDVHGLSSRRLLLKSRWSPDNRRRWCGCHNMRFRNLRLHDMSNRRHCPHRLLHQRWLPAHRRLHLVLSHRSSLQLLLRDRSASAKLEFRRPQSCPAYGCDLRQTRTQANTAAHVTWFVREQNENLTDLEQLVDYAVK